MLITLKNANEIAKISKAARIVSQTLKYLPAKGIIMPGLTTDGLNDLIEKYIMEQGGRPAFKGYRGFPKASCISINDEVVHGIPSARELRSGDLVKIDIGAECEGFYADAARTFFVGKIDTLTRKLCEVTKRALALGIAKARTDNHLTDISHAIQAHVEDNGFSVVRELGGHGIGVALHEDPMVPNFGPAGSGPVLKPGMVLAIEPMVNIGKPDVLTKDNGWTVVTKDGSLSAHFEDTIVLTERGVINLTNGAC